MLITQKKHNQMKDRITNLEGQVEALTTQKIEERNIKMKEIGNLDDKIITLDKEKRTAQNDLVDLQSEKRRGEEEIKHQVKIVMEKHDLELEKSKEEHKKKFLEKEAKIIAEFRDKREKQLEELSDKMEGMYKDMLKNLTTVTGTLNQPARVQEAK